MTSIDTKAALEMADYLQFGHEARAAAMLRSQDSLVSWIGGYTGNGPMTADRIAAAIRAFGAEEDEADGAPWCHQCGAQTQDGCKCGPIAENN